MKRIQIFTALWRETNALYVEWARQHHLSYCELLVVLSLAEKEKGCLQKEICKQWTLPKQTVNTVLKSFMEQSLVNLSPSQEDRRAKTIDLTEKGKLFCKKISQQLQTVERKVWDEMGEANSKVLIEEMTLYNHLLKEMVDCETKDI